MIARECLATRMRRLNRVVSSIYDRAFRVMGVTGSQMSILVVLAHMDGAKPGEVCQALQMDKSTLCRNAQRMQRRGWVQATATQDARSHRLEVTEVGRELIERALPLWRVAQDQAREALGNEVAGGLFGVMDVPFSGEGSGGRGVMGVKNKVSEDLERVPRDSGPSKEKVIFFWE